MGRRGSRADDRLVRHAGHVRQINCPRARARFVARSATERYDRCMQQNMRNASDGFQSQAVVEALGRT